MPFPDGRSETNPDSGDDATPSSCASTPNTLYAPAAKDIVPDGDLAEWGTLCWLTLQCPTDWVEDSGSCDDRSDISARFAARWSSTALYFAFEVTDDSHRNTSASDPYHLYEGDSVQVGFDTKRNGGSPYDTSDDFEYGWALDGKKLVTYRWYAPANAPAAATNFLIKRSANVTRYEIVVSAGDLGQTSFSAGMSMRFSTLVNDDDETGREGYLQWTPGMGYSPKNPGQFGLLELIH